ncbi:hypothetical protein GGR52DRAFT_575133 [Hypoxylon sp. FL1284]|nr:hypothetical protein GGR52DRAFT_575133 [Hypoxylon sp. FL1284]
MSPSSTAATRSQSKSETGFKDRLDRAAENARASNDGHESRQPSLAETVARYVPPAADLLGVASQEKNQVGSPRPVSGLPERPRHDERIEEFVRDQHTSKKPDYENEIRT